MTVNCIYVTDSGVVHATDSLITKRIEGSSERIQSELSGKPKIVLVPSMAGAMSWFGTVSYLGWDAMDWLTDRAKEAEAYTISEAQEYASHLAHQLGEELYSRKMSLPALGIGIHFTFFEPVEGLKDPVPELIFITNFSEISYKSDYRTGEHKLQALRRLYHDITGQQDLRYELHDQPEVRKAVYEFLSLVGPMWYTNGSTLLTNASSTVTDSAVHTMIMQRRLADKDPLRLYGKKALYRAEIACLTEKRFCNEEKVLVGEPCHNLMITPDGRYLSDTGLVQDL